MKIAIIGTHGTGKTTLAYQICAEAKKRGKNAVILNETARSCPFPINEGSSLDGFIWMTGTQLAKEQAALAHKSEFIVCDRSVLDHVCYVPFEMACGKIFEYFKMACIRWMDTYDKIFWVHPSSIDIQNDGIRDTNKGFQKQIHCRFQEILGQMIGSKRVKTIDSSKIFEGNLDSIMKEAFKPVERVGE